MARAFFSFVMALLSTSAERPPAGNIPRIAVIGAAHLDVIARVTCGNVVLDQIGTASMHPGGTAFNVAVAAARAGAHAHLLTSLPKSTLAAIIESELTEQGVAPQIWYDESMDVGIFSAHIGKDGSLLSAITSSTLDTAHFPDSWLEDRLKDMSMVIADANLSDSVLLQVNRLTQQMEIPLWIHGVSETKSLRVTQLFARGLSPQLFVLNRTEMSFVKSHGDFLSTADLAARMGGMVLVTEGTGGVTVAYADQTRRHFSLGSSPVLFVDATGAGDRLLGTCAAAMGDQRPFEAALQASIEQVRNDLLRRAEAQRSAPTIHVAAPLAAQMQRMEQAALCANKDAMTGLWNRRGAKALISRLMRAEEGALMALDIDHFKEINDLFGHDTGDRAIQVFANLLTATLRGADTAIRWGGDEFICLLESVSAEDAAQIATRILQNVRTQQDIDVTITCSIGICHFSRVRLDERELLSQADQALYAAKRAGRDGYVLTRYA